MYNQTRIEVTLFAFRSGVGSDFRFRVERRSGVTLADPRTGALLRRLFAGLGSGSFDTGAGSLFRRRFGAGLGFNFRLFEGVLSSLTLDAFRFSIVTVGSKML